MAGQLLRYFPPYIFTEKAQLIYDNDPSIVYALPVESLDVGQTIGVVFRNPNDGLVALTLVTEDGDFVLRVAFRINFGGDQDTVIINSWKNGVWKRQITVENFPENGTTIRIALFVTVEEEGFDISANDIYFGFFSYRNLLTYDKVKYILWNAWEESATIKSVLRQISINFPRQK